MAGWAKQGRVRFYEEALTMVFDVLINQVGQSQEYGGGGPGAAYRLAGASLAGNSARGGARQAAVAGRQGG